MVQFDWSVGEILKMLNELGLTEKTLVVFSSDNGPVYDDGYADGTTVKTSKQEVDRGHDASGIFRGGKYQIYEGGTRVPLIISWPGQISPGVSDAVVSQIDFMASFAGLLGMDLPADSATDSRNILPVLLGENSNLTDGPVLEHAARRLALRQGRFKYIPPVNGRGAELYNLDNDPGETANLAKMMPERCEELDARMDQLLTSGIRSVFSSSFEESAQ
jgi:arylsulfatase A-like enzyme